MKRSVWGMALCTGALFSGTAAASNWHLYPATCQGGTAAAEIQCGAYGRYLVDQQTAPACAPQRFAVSQVVPIYPAPETLVTFSTRARRLNESPAPLAEVSSKPGKTASVHLLPGPGPSNRWLVVVDYGEGSHGDSTAALAGYVAGSAVTPHLVPLERSDLGDRVGDLHVLAALCAVAEAMDDGNTPAPDTVNMSFGRHREVSDPLTPAACAVQNVACEIAGVVQYLSARTTLVAAAGNHGELLFPASLDAVISVGMLDLTRFLDIGDAKPAWETPAGVDALIPGNSLCLGSWAAPAGSSYSSAMLAGWLPRVLRRPDILASLGNGRWNPVWSDSVGSYVLGRGSNATPWYNQAIDAIFDELSGSTAPCWSAASTPVATAITYARPHVPSPIPSLDAQGAPTGPQPESDPCVPCSGALQIHGSATDLLIDLSQSQPLPTEIYLDEVALRVEAEYVVLELTPGDLEKMQEGLLAYLLVPNVGPLVMPDVSASLWYRMREGATACDEGGSCFWSSTPLLIDK